MSTESLKRSKVNWISRIIISCRILRMVTFHAKLGGTLKFCEADSEERVWLTGRMWDDFLMNRLDSSL